MLSSDALFVGFPQPPEATGTVKVTVGNESTVAQGLTVTLSGESNRGTPYAGDPVVTDQNGVALFENVPVADANKYQYEIAGTGVGYSKSDGQPDGKNYTAAPAQASGNVGAVTEGESATEVNVGIAEVTAKYPIKLNVVNRMQEPLTLAENQLTFGGSSVMGFAGNGGAYSFNTSASGTGKPLTIGLPGYQVTTVDLDLTPGAGQNQIGKLELSNIQDAAVAKVTGNAADGYTVTMTLPKVLTNVSFPLKLNSEAPLTEADVAGLSVTFTPNATHDAGTGALLTELGGKPLTLSVANGGIAVATSNTRAESPAVTGLTVTAPLPDGAYDMQVGGVGFESNGDIPVAVLTFGQKTVATVGGEITFDGTAVKSVTGGVTASATPTRDAAGNASISLAGSNAGVTGTTVTEGGAVTVVDNSNVTLPQKGDEGVTDLTAAGLTGASDAVIKDMTPNVVTDPIYVVEVTEAAGSTSANRVYQAKVYLKNATAYAGTFGLYFDKKLFDNDGVTVTPYSDSNYSIQFQAGDALVNSGAVVSKNDSLYGYVLFNWSMASGNKVDASASQREIATIKLPVLSGMVGELGNRLSTGSFKSMNFKDTAEGNKIMNQVDGNPTEEDKLFAMSTFWRASGYDPNREEAAGSKRVLLDDTLARNGGFYQIMQNAAFEGDAVMGRLHDVRMDISMPDTVKKLEADFQVEDTNVEPGKRIRVEGAVIKVYPESAKDTEGGLEKAEPFATLTTDANGKAFVALDAGTYIYTVTHKSYWAYPDGTIKTSADNKDYDTFTISTNSASGLTEITTSGKAKPDDTNTDVILGGICINPLMEPMSYHKVNLTTVKAEDGSTRAETRVKLSGESKAYNGEHFYFTLKPVAGYEWNKDNAAYDDMGKIAGAIKAVVYAADGTADGTAGEDSVYQTGGGTAATVKWDAVREQFYIEGGDIAGSAVGENAASKTQDWFDFLRAGNIVVTLKDDMLKQGAYTITAIAGAGGAVTLDPDASLTEPDDGNTDQDAKVEATASITETISDGRTTSGVFTFTPDSGKRLDKVVVNGADIVLTEGQKLPGAVFTHQFTNVGENQMIVATFADVESDTPVSAPVINVTLGGHGSAELTYTKNDAASPATETIKGGENKTYIGKAGNGATLTIKPDTGTPKYEIDKVVVTLNGTALDSAYNAETGTVTFSAENLSAGATASVIVTFKEEGKESTQIIVDASVQYGFGSVTPLGNKIYAKGDTPSFVLSPEEKWKLVGEDAIVTDGKNAYTGDEITSSESYTYTMPALTGDATVEIYFSEVTVQIQGKLEIQSAYGAQVSPAILTFTRRPIPGGTGTTDVKFTTGSTPTAVSGDNGYTMYLPFSGDLSSGEWDLVVRKPGYLTYTITGFIVADDATQTIYFGDPTSEGGTVAGTADKMKPIDLTPGDARRDGIVVDYGDIGMVAGGWLDNALEINMTYGDMDENNYDPTTGKSTGRTNTADMSLVTMNLLEYRTKVTYKDFAGITEPTVPET